MSAPLPIARRARRRTQPLPAAWWAGGIAAVLLAVLAVVGTAVALKGRQRAAQVADSATSGETAGGEVRLLDEKAKAELYDAFAANRLAAEEKYAKVRWRIDITPQHIDESGVVDGVRTYSFRNRSDLLKLSIGKRCRIDAVCRLYTNTAAGPVESFEDAVLVTP